MNHLKNTFLLTMFMSMSIGLMATPISRQEAQKKVASFLASRGKAYKTSYTNDGRRRALEVESNGYY